MSTKPFNIGVGYWSESPIVLSIRKGLFEELDRLGLSYEVKIYDCNGNNNLISSNIEDVIDQEYDLLFTSGIPVTVRAKETIDKKKIDMPLVFAGIAQPEDYNLIESRESSGNNLTGVAFDWDKYCDMTPRVEVLFEVRPHLEKIVIPFSEDAQFLHNRAARFEKEIQEQARKRNKNVQVIKLPIKTASETLEKLKSHHDADAIILLRDSILSFVSGIAKFCNNHHITLYTSELESVRSGAGIGCGQDEYYTGVACAKLIYEILHNKKKPSELPITSFYNIEVNINEKTKDLQGISFDRDKAQSELLKKARLIS